MSVSLSRPGAWSCSLLHTLLSITTNHSINRRCRNNLACIHLEVELFEALVFVLPQPQPHPHNTVFPRIIALLPYCSVSLPGS